MRTTMYSCPICGKDADPRSKLGYCKKHEQLHQEQQEEKKKKQEEEILRRQKKGGR